MIKYDCTIDPSIRYNVYLRSGDSLIKSGCTLQAIIPAGLPLNDDQVRKLFGTDESSKYWKRQHRASCYDRFVFDKCIVTNNPVMYRIEVESD